VALWSAPGQSDAVPLGPMLRRSRGDLGKLPGFLPISATGVPASPWRNTMAICSPVNRRRHQAAPTVAPMEGWFPPAFG
jgi:hypothetical protein